VGYDEVGEFCAISSYSSGNFCGACDVGIWVEFGINQELTEVATAPECYASQGEYSYIECVCEIEMSVEGY